MKEVVQFSKIEWDEFLKHWDELYMKAVSCNNEIPKSIMDVIYNIDSLISKDN